jgi:hypothetical protein
MQLGRTVRLIEMSSCKFLKVVSPDKKSEAIFSMDLILKDRALHVKASGKNDLGVFLKLNAVYIA